MFSENKNILLTGATGFLGSVILYDLLIKTNFNIFVIIREKKNLTIKERLELLYNKKIFDLIPKETFMNRIQLIKGNIIEPLLGISDENIELIKENINFIIHSAASINFNESLPIAALNNIYPSTQILKIAKECKNLLRWIHVSTAYVNSPNNNLILPQLTPQLDYDPELLLDLIDKKLINFAEIKKNHSNTYTCTKEITEHLLNNFKDKMNAKIIIVRPSIIGASYSSPLPNWCDSIAAISGYLCLIFSGIADYGYGIKSERNNINVIPVDFVSEDIINVLNIKITKKLSIFHSTATHPIDFYQFEKKVINAMKVYQFPGLNYCFTTLEKTDRFTKLIFDYLFNIKIAVIKIFDNKKADKIVKLRKECYNNFNYFTSNFWNYQPSFRKEINLDRYYNNLIINTMSLLKQPKDKYIIVGKDNNNKQLTFLWAMPWWGELFLSTVLGFIQYYIFGSWFYSIIGCIFYYYSMLNYYSYVIRKEFPMPIRIMGMILRLVFNKIFNKVTIDTNSFANSTANRNIKSNIFICTHRSYLDFLLLPFALFDRTELNFKKLHIVAAMEFSEIPIIGSILSSLGAHFIKRTPGSNNSKFEHKVIELMKQGKNLLVFPEGTRSRTRLFLPFKTGVIKIAQKSGIDIRLIPISISYQKRPEEARLEKELAGKKQPFFSLVDFSSWSMSMLSGNINLGDVHIAAGKASILTKDTDVDEIMHQMLNQLKLHTVIWEHQLINMEPEECELFKLYMRQNKIRLFSSKNNPPISATEKNAYKHFLESQEYLDFLIKNNYKKKLE